MWRSWVIFAIGMVFVSLFLLSVVGNGHISTGLRTSASVPGSSESSDHSVCPNAASADLTWYPPTLTSINNLSKVIHGSDVYGLIFNSSTTPSEVPYSTYNYCNMPRVRAQEYLIPGSGYTLEYVELIHRHHKRTTYASNAFPEEEYSWDCSDSHLYYYAATPPSEAAARINWQISESNINPFPSTGFPRSSCQFPQITSGGLRDCHQHGIDLRSVYIDKLHFLPKKYDSEKIKFRTTNNVITSEVASQVIIGLYPSLSDQSIPVTVQPAGIDSLEPQYPCPEADRISSSFGIGSNNSAWLEHLEHPKTNSLLAQLDAVSGVNISDPAWHEWFDHYFDNLSSKLCHSKPLGCNLTNQSLCLDQEIAHAVFRRGLYEYSYLYRDNPYSLQASTASFGVWIAELAVNIREAINRREKNEQTVIWRHNIAHDGSISKLLSILQVDVMVWPGMGSEIVFEIWRQRSGGKCWFLRILWKGQPLKSSNPSLNGDEAGSMPVEQFLAYVDGLVGVRGEKVPGLCTVN